MARRVTECPGTAAPFVLREVWQFGSIDGRDRPHGMVGPCVAVERRIYDRHMGQALLTLAAAIVGGGLVLVGDISARRAQWRRELRLMLREKGAEWAASVNQARSTLTGARLERRDLNADEKLMWDDRARASTVFYSVPGSERLHDQRVAVQRALQQLARSLHADDLTWEAAQDHCRQEIVHFTDKLRSVVGGKR